MMTEEVVGGGLTAGASIAISNDEYHYGRLCRNHNEEADDDESDNLNATNEVSDDGERIVMQVVSLARLKYSVRCYFSDDQKDSREDFQSGTSICYANDKKYWGDDTPYRFILSDGSRTIAGKFYSESPGFASRFDFKEPGKIHKTVHELVTTGQLKEGSIISFVPNCHIHSGKGIVTMFHMKVEGWKEIIGRPTPCHDGVLSYSPIGVHQCTVPHTGIMADKRPINSAVVQLAKIIKEVCGHCTISGSAALAEYFHHLPGCEHCYEKNFSTLIRDKCIEGGLNNDVDIFVPEYPEKLTHYYNTGIKKIDLSTVSDRFDRALLESSIFPKLYRRYGIRHTDIVDTNISLSRLGDEDSEADSLRPYRPLHHTYAAQRTVDYGCK